MLNFFIAFHYLLNRSKSFLSINSIFTFIGVLFPVAFFVIVLSVFNGFQRQLKESLYKFDPHIKVTNTSQNARINNWQDWQKKIAASLGKTARTVEPMIESVAIIRKNRRIDYVLLRGQYFASLTDDAKYSVPDDFPNIIAPAGMRSFDYGESVFIGKEMAMDFGLKVGDFLEIIVPRGQFNLEVGVTPSMQSYKVAGIFKSGHYEIDSKSVIIPVKEAQNLFRIGDSIQEIIVKLHDPDLLRVSAQKVMRIMPFSFQITTLEDEKRNFFAALRLEKTLMSIIVYLFVIIGILLILFISLNQVWTKKKDIGILKAMGFSRLRIASIFTINGLIMGSLGVVLGIFFGVFLATNLEAIIAGVQAAINFTGEIFRGKEWAEVELIPRDVYYFDRLPVYFDWFFLKVVGALTIFMIFLATVIPALVASSYHPIRIIREADK